MAFRWAPRQLLSRFAVRRAAAGEPTKGLSNAISPLNENTSLKLHMTNCQKLRRELDPLHHAVAQALSIADSLRDSGSVTASYEAREAAAKLQSIMIDMEAAWVLADLED